MCVARLLLAATWLCLLFTNGQCQVCPHVRSVALRGDVIIGGLFDIHVTGDNNKECGEVIDIGGVQRVEAMLFAVDKLNKEDFIPGVKIGKALF